MKNKLLYLAIAALCVTMAGCATTPTDPNAGQINLAPVKTVTTVVTVPEDTLLKCKKPQQLSVVFTQITKGIINEDDLVVALVVSYNNETKCYLASQEAISLQRSLTATATAGNTEAPNAGK